MKKIAFLGGTSHVGEGLISRFLADKDVSLSWFGRSAEKMKKFLHTNSLSGNIQLKEGYDDFPDGAYDVIINCVGAGTPEALKENYSLWFTVLEQFDNLALDYLREVNEKVLYVTFSSGALYGRNLQSATDENSCYSINPNKIGIPDYYAVAKLYAEAKHRSLSRLNIVDLRIFAYFSRFADPDSGYLMTDILKALLDKKPLNTRKNDLVRDYIAPDDLYSLVLLCMNQESINRSLDAYSAAPVSKTEMLKAFSEKFKLQVNFVDDIAPVSPNATSSVYCSNCHFAEKIGYRPKYTSLEGLADELAHALEKTGK